MSPFVFVILLVLAISVGRTVREVMLANIQSRSPDALGHGGSVQVQSLQEQVDSLTGRLERLEEERDFYKDLLDAPTGARGLTPPTDTPPTEE